jgi:hypothetical protein
VSDAGFGDLRLTRLDFAPGHIPKRWSGRFSSAVFSHIRDPGMAAVGFEADSETRERGIAGKR